jgi:short-subunit dehydrogenase
MNDSRERLSLLSKLTIGAAALGAASYAVRQAARRRRRIDFNGKTVLISGASRGLGLELARGFADEGADLILLARDENNLAHSASELRRYGVHVDTTAVDVSNESQVHDALSSLFADGRTVDVLVNNAGTIQVGPVENMELDDFENAMGVHFWGPLYLMQELLPHMQARGEGRIVNIASIGGKVAVPHLLPYAASKFALVGLSEGMRAELLKDGIYVTTVCPGLMRTGSHLNAHFKGQHKKEYALFAIANASPLLSTTSGSAARKIIEACRYGQAELVITPQARLLRVAQCLFPNFTADMLGLVNQILPKAREGEGDKLMRGAESRSAMAPSVLTRLADRAASRNNETPSAPAEFDDAAPDFDEDESLGPLLCVCTHATHFLGRCQNEVDSPQHTCPECMESHFHRVDDPTI